MMIRAFFIACLFVGTCSIAIGQQNPTISGRVTDASSQPIAGATIHLLNTNTGTFTDALGDFTLEVLTAGEYTIQVTAVGFAAKKISVSSGTELSIQLEESATQLDDVVITAEKIEEDLQKIPLSVTAITEKQVRQFRLWNSKDLSAIVPNLYSGNSGDNRNVTSIRGIATTSYDPAVATYIDGVNQFGLDTYIAQLFDVERIEVLRGPQGTLYGRNAMGGVVNIITKQPTNVTHGFAEINIGNYAQQRYTAAFRTPLVKDKLFLGIAGMYDKTNGYYNNEFDNSDFDKRRSFTGNYFLKYLINQQWALTANIKHVQNRNNGAFPLTASPQNAIENPFTVNQNAGTELVDNIFNGSLTASYAGTAFNFSSQTAYQSDYRYYRDPIDGDFSPIDGITIINNYGKDWNNVKVFTQEFKLSSPATAAPLQWTGGVYLFSQDNPVKQATHFGEDAAFIDPMAIPGSASISTSTGTNRGMAFYGQAAYNLSNNFEVAAGLRYDYEHKKQDVFGQFKFDNDPDAIVTQPDTTATTSYNAFSPKISLSYHANSNKTLYLTFSRGYRAGGLTQLGPDPSQPPLYAFKPEYSNNIELGSKNTFLNSKVQLNISLFYINVTDVQVPTLVLPQAVTVTRNAGKLTSKGAELELLAAPVKGLQINYTFGYNKARYGNSKFVFYGNEIQLKGNHQIFTPDVTSMLALQYDYPLSHKVKFTIRGEWMYFGEQYFDLANNIRQAPYNLLNVRTGFSLPHVELLFWGRNLSDEKYIAYAYDFGATHLGDPLTYGMTLRVSY